MSFEKDHIDALAEEPKDHTKWLWLSVVVLVAIIAVCLWLQHRQGRDATEVRVKHILVKCNKSDPTDRARALERINELRGRLEKGESFEKLARDYSNDEYSSGRGGDMGYYPQGKFETEFEKVAWTLPVGQLSDVVQTSNGFHLMIVVDRHYSQADQHEQELEEKARKSGAVDVPKKEN